MPISHVRYPLHDGFIHNWLVVGPQAIEIENLEHFTGEDFRLQILRRYYEAESGIIEPPVEPGALTDGVVQIGDFKENWRYVRCPDDHFVDLSLFKHTAHYVRAWAYAEVESQVESDVTLTLTTNGPADVWLNDVHIHRQEHMHHNQPHGEPFTAHVVEGRNRILARFENVATRNCTFVMALCIENPKSKIENPVLIPTAIEPVTRRNKLERIFDAAYVEQDYFIREEQLTVRWPDDLDEKAGLMVRLRTPEGRIYGEAKKEVAADTKIPMGYAYQFPDHAYDIVLMPRPEEYYEKNMRISRSVRTWGMGINKYHAEPYGTFDERRREALLSAARSERNVYAEIAKMAIGWWSRLEVMAILETIDGINQRRDCSDFYLVGLLGMLYRFGDDERFPDELRQPLEDCALNFKYWYDEPGSDAMWYWSENHQILFHACEILAGQLYPDRVFTNNGQTGQWHREHGEQLALPWLRDRGMHGFSEWDSNCYFEEDLLALSHLADLAETDAVWELASVLIDKILFSIAVNSYKGIFGSTHGRSYGQFIKGGYREGTSGITNLMWGMGIFNDRILGTVSMALMENYDLPVLLQVIAADLPEALWSHEHHAPVDQFRETGDGVDKVTYKTPDFMLCSAQDYRPGDEGRQQHIWQATLGPGATVFVNHPSCASEDNSRRPNFWSGNFVLPRVAQWKDALVAVHKLPDDDWMGFTHAYFPIHAFDAYALREDASGRTWAFAKKGDGYLAITASLGVTLVTSGDTAYRELRSQGLHNVWFCQMGRAALDGDFTAFQEKVLALDVAFDDLAVRAETLRGDTLAFGWEGAFLRNGEDVPLHGYKHYDSPYCVAEFPAEEMVIVYGGTAMRLAFA